jgi:hypothetical protein
MPGKTQELTSSTTPRNLFSRNPVYCKRTQSALAPRLAVRREVGGWQRDEGAGRGIDDGEKIGDCFKAIVFHRHEGAIK